MHTTHLNGNVLASGEPAILYYAEMKKNLFVSPEAYSAARDSYLNGLTLRNSLNMAVMGFGVADLAIGTGAVIILLGIATLGLAVPVLYWARQSVSPLVPLDSHSSG